MRKNNSGFTLMELLTVIAIIAILAGILMPALTAARKQARRAECISNLKQVGIAIQAFALDNQGKLPANAQAALLSYLPVGPDGRDVRKCPATAAGVFYTPNAALDGATLAESKGPTDELVGCAGGSHPGTKTRNVLYGDGHVEPAAAP